MTPPEPIPRPERTDRTAITGPLMAQYLMALLTAQRGGGTAARGDIGGDPLMNIFGRLALGGGLGALGGGLGGEGQANGGGRWGDYVFNQEGTSMTSSHINVFRNTDNRTALDEIITQLMENSNSGRPVPATDEIIDNLPRETLSAGCTSCGLRIHYVLIDCLQHRYFKEIAQYVKSNSLSTQKTLQRRSWQHCPVRIPFMKAV